MLSNYKSLALAGLFLAALASGLTPAFAQTYDLVILGGRVMDPETRFDDIANVGIVDGEIVEEDFRGQYT